MKIIKSHPGISPFITEGVSAYLEGDVLDSFMTTFVYHDNFILSKILKSVFGKEMLRRGIGTIPVDKVKTYPFFELLRTFFDKANQVKLTDYVWEKGEHAFDRWVASNLTNNLTAVEVTEHSGLATLLEAKKKGIVGILEQPSQHYLFFNKIISLELAKYPEIQNEYSKLQIDEKSVLRNKRRDAEIAAADFIICNSTFTKKTLVESNLISASSILVIPYGFPKLCQEKKLFKHNKVIFLNAGTQNFRKGLHLLYRSWQKITDYHNIIELWLIGKMTLPEHLRQGIGSNVKIMPSVIHQELMGIYNEVDVFILPTLADGFGMVIAEAMSRGIPVITTYNSGGFDIIEHGKDGFLIPAGDEIALTKQILWCIEHRHLLTEIGNNAIQKAKKWQWSDHRKLKLEKVTGKIQEIFDNKLIK